MPSPTSAPSEGDLDLCSSLIPLELDDSATASDTELETDTNDKLIDDPVWTTGDTVLVSYDRVRFRLPSYHLLSSSPVFCSKHDASSDSPKTITLSNPEFDTAATLRLYLHLVMNGELDCHPKADDYLALLPLTLFLREYKCKSLLATFLLIVRERHRKDALKPICAFAVGAVADDLSTMAQSLECPISVWYDDTLNEGKTGPTPTMNVFDPLHWPLALWRAVPAQVTWQLAEAWNNKGSSTGLSKTFCEALYWIQMQDATNLIMVMNASASCSNIRDDFKWSTGDFELISTDNVKFRIASFDLFSHSGFFRDAHLISGDKDMSVTFTDPEFETADTLRLVLSLIKTSDLPLPRRPEPKVIVRLITFLRKYDCATDIKTLLLLIRDKLREDQLCPFFAFVAGAAADDTKTCLIALDNFSVKWAHTSRKSQSVWNPYFLPLSYWRYVPSTHLWALCKAWGTAAKLQLQKVATEFGEFLKAAQSPASSASPAPTPTPPTPTTPKTTPTLAA